jgi:hypothetical protein
MLLIFFCFENGYYISSTWWLIYVDLSTSQYHLAIYFHVFLTFHIFQFDMNLLQNGWHQRAYTMLFQNNILVIAKLLPFAFIVVKGLLSCYNMDFSRSSNWTSCNVTSPCILQIVIWLHISYVYLILYHVVAFECLL